MARDSVRRRGGETEWSYRIGMKPSELCFSASAECGLRCWYKSASISRHNYTGKTILTEHISIRRVRSQLRMKMCSLVIMAVHLFEVLFLCV